MQNEKLLYESIRDELTRQIGSGELAVQAFLPTVKELQCQFQVSHITILHVLRNLRDMGLIEHSGRRYRVCRSMPVESMSSSSSAELPAGIFVRPVRSASYNHYFNDINLAIESELCLAHKYYVRSSEASVFNYQLLFSDERCQDLLRALLTLDAHCCGTLIDERVPDGVLSEFLARKSRPAVLVNRSTTLPISSVGISASYSSRLLWQRARQLGYTDIVMRSLRHLNAYNERAFGLASEALSRSGSFPDIRLHLVENDEDDSWVLQEMTRKYGEFGANRRVLFLFRNNELAYMFMGLMGGQGRQYGRDYGVCGFYMSSENDGYAEQLTTVQIDTDYIGRSAVRSLLKQCYRPWQEEVSRMDCPQKLIFGETM